MTPVIYSQVVQSKQKHPSPQKHTVIEQYGKVPVSDASRGGRLYLLFHLLCLFELFII